MISQPFKLLLLAAKQGCTVETLVERTLSKHGGRSTRGSIAAAARELGISTTNLSRYINGHTYPERDLFQIAE